MQALFKSIKWSPALFSLGLALLFAVPGWSQALDAEPSGAVATAGQSDVPSVPELYRRYLENNGGRANLAALNTIAVTGVIERGGAVSARFRVFQKRPNKMRMRMEFEAYTVETIFNGERGWREYISADGERSAQELSEAVILELKDEATIEGPFFRAARRPEALGPVTFDEVRGQPSVRITCAAEAGIPHHTIWLSAENFQEVKVARNVPSESGEDILETVYFSEFDRIDGIHLARKIEYFYDGALERTIRIENVRSNIGIFDHYFERVESE